MMELKKTANSGAVNADHKSGKDLEAVYDIPVKVSAVLGKATMEVP